MNTLKNAVKDIVDTHLNLVKRSIKNIANVLKLYNRYIIIISFVHNHSCISILTRGRVYGV